MEYFNKNAGAIQAIAAMLTVLLALGGLLGVKAQIDSADRIQRAQSARDIYREFLGMAVNKPEFAAPDYCNIRQSQQAASYEAFVEHLLYSAEQAMAIDQGWDDTFLAAFEPHAAYLCQFNDVSGFDDNVAALRKRFKASNCAKVVAC